MGRCKNRIRNRAKDGMIGIGSSAGTLTDHRRLVQSWECKPPRASRPPGRAFYLFVSERGAAWLYLPPNINRQMTTETTTPVRSAIRPAATACRVRRTATEPKYTAMHVKSRFRAAVDRPGGAYDQPVRPEVVEQIDEDPLRAAAAERAHQHDRQQVRREADPVEKRAAPSATGVSRSMPVRCPETCRWLPASPRGNGMIRRRDGESPSFAPRRILRVNLDSGAIAA